VKLNVYDAIINISDACFMCDRPHIAECCKRQFCGEGNFSRFCYVCSACKKLARRMRKANCNNYETVLPDGAVYFVTK